MKHLKYLSVTRAGFSLVSTLFYFLLAGCAQKFTPVITPGSSVASSPLSSSNKSSLQGKTGTSRDSETISGKGDITNDMSGTSRLSQCSRELGALKQFNSAKYATYKAELDHITRTGAQYLAVSNGISQDINDLVQPRYQYALTSLCQRVRADLSAALINQVTIK